MRVMPALRLRGSLKAVMPLEMASTPVSALVPLAKACRSRNSVTPRIVPTTSTGGGETTRPRVPTKYRASAVPTVTNIMAMKKYVGTAKIFPDSFTPRRFTIMITPTSTAAITAR